MIYQYNTKGHHTDKILNELMYLYIKTEEYDKAKFFLSEYLKLPFSQATDEQKNYVECCIKKGSGIRLSESDIDSSYYINQLDNFEKEKTIVFLKNNFSLQNKNGNFNQTGFYEDADLSNLFDSITNILEPEYLYPKISYFDQYLFKIKNVGLEFTGKECNYIKVLVQKNTKNIVSIIPAVCISEKEQYCYDLDQLILKKDLNKINYKTPKTKSGIERFNKKYNIG